MRALLQRAARAEVRVAGDAVGRIDRGLVVLLGVGQGDRTEEAERLAAKVAKLRVFADRDGKMNRSLVDVGGSALVISQFTLFADTRSGTRPGFSAAAPPGLADELYRAFARALEDRGVPVRTGVFGAAMQVELVNDGPVTLMLEVPPPDGPG